MKTKVALTIILAFISSFTFSQAEKALFFSKKHQHSISFEPIAISYDYTYAFSKKYGVGMRVQTGFGLRYIIQPQLDVTDINIVDNLSIQFQYRFLFPKYFHLDIGPQITFGTMDGFNEIIGLNYGLGISAFFHYKKLQIGLRIHAVFFETSSCDYDLDGNPLDCERVIRVLPLTSPFVIGIAF